MEKEKFEEYLKDRYENQIDWYDKKAILNQRLYKFFQWIVVVTAAVTPVAVALIKIIGNIYPIILSVIVAVASGLLKTFKYQENWINYRTTCETLRKEIHFYNAKIDDYEYTDNPNGLFVKRVENLVSRENTLWVTSQKQKNE